jgi:TetR/AcrR family transcriptional regulator, cholesterol catabolism regulator
VNAPELNRPQVSGMTPRQRERRERIIETTLDLLMKNSENIEVRDIVNAADVSLATIYRYFGSKEILFSEVYLSWRRRHFDEVIAAMSKCTNDSDRLRTAVFTFIEPYRKMPRMWEISSETRNSHLPEIVELRRGNEALLYSTFRGAMHEVGDKDAEGIVMIMIAVAALYLSQWRSGDATFEDVRAAISRSIELTLDIRTKA